MIELAVTALMCCGALFILLAAVGIVRMPDLYTRMQTTTKATTLGIGCLTLGVAVYFGDWDVWVRTVAIVAFLYMTAPVAAHVIARAGYFVRTERWKGTVRDDLAGRYDAVTHELSSEARTPPAE